MVVFAAPPALNLGLFLSGDEVDVPLGTAGRHDADIALVGVSACDCLPFDGHGTVGMEVPERSDLRGRSVVMRSTTIQYSARL